MEGTLIKEILFCRCAVPWTFEMNLKLLILLNLAREFERNKAIPVTGREGM
jgi:hypothetical protein